MTHDAEAASGHPCAVDWSSMATSIGSRDGGGELTSCTLSSGCVPLFLPVKYIILFLWIWVVLLQIGFQDVEFLPS